MSPPGGFEPQTLITKVQCSKWLEVAGKADQTIDMQNTQTLAKHTRDTVEILVSPMLIQTGKPDEAEVATDQAYTSAG